MVVLAVLAMAVAGPAPQPGPEPQPAAAAAAGAQAQAGPGPVSVTDQESQASESVSKRGAARLSPVSGNSIVDNTVSSAPQSLQPLQPQLTTYSSTHQQQQQQLQQQLQQQQQQQPQQPLYAPHPYSFIAPQYQYQYQPALPALPPLLHSKYHAPSKQHVLQYVPQPYFQMPQYQAPLMYLIPQPQPAQAHHAQPASGQQSAGQPEQSAHHHQQPQQYVMVLSAPAAGPAQAGPVAANGFQYFGHPLLAQQPQQLITFYAGPQHGQVAQPQLHQAQPQLHQAQPNHHQLHHIQLQQPQLHQPQTRFYPEQQQLVFQSPQPEGPSSQNDGPPHFVQKQNSQGPVGLEAPPTPASLVGTYGARVQHQHQQPQHQHAYKTIIKA